MPQMDRPFSLRVVPLDQVFLHENVDPHRVERLANRLAVDDMLVNPPIVIEAGDRYVVLDGATRTTALKQLGYPHTVVQVILAPDQLTLHTWFHTIRGADPDELIQRLDDLSEIEMLEHESPKALGAVLARKRVCYLHTIEDRIFLVRAAVGVDELEALNQVTKTYIDTSHLTRTLTTDMTALRQEYPDLTALVVFPQYTIEQVLQIAQDGRLLPSGITRFIIPGRVLRVNIDLPYLKSNKSLAEKNQWLNQIMKDKLAHGRIRYYEEPVYLLDE